MAIYFILLVFFFLRVGARGWCNNPFHSNYDIVSCKTTWNNSRQRGWPITKQEPTVLMDCLRSCGPCVTNIILLLSSHQLMSYGLIIGSLGVCRFSRWTSNSQIWHMILEGWRHTQLPLVKKMRSEVDCSNPRGLSKCSLTSPLRKESF